MGLASPLPNGFHAALSAAAKATRGRSPSPEAAGGPVKRRSTVKSPKRALLAPAVDGAVAEAASVSVLPAVCVDMVAPAAEKAAPRRNVPMMSPPMTVSRQMVLGQASMPTEGQALGHLVQPLPAAKASVTRNVLGQITLGLNGLAKGPQVTSPPLTSLRRTALGQPPLKYVVRDGRREVVQGKRSSLRNEVKVEATSNESSPSSSPSGLGLTSLVGEHGTCSPVPQLDAPLEQPIDWTVGSILPDLHAEQRQWPAAQPEDQAEGPVQRQAEACMTSPPASPVVHPCEEPMDIDGEDFALHVKSFNEALKAKSLTSDAWSLSFEPMDVDDWPAVLETHACHVPAASDAIEWMDVD